MNYSKFVIYKISCKDETVNDLYVGHTFNLYMRNAKHKSNCNNPKSKLYNCKLYQFIRSNGGFENWNIEVIENYTEYNSLENARQRERYWIEVTRANLIICRPIITSEEKKEKMKEYHKEYNKRDKYKQYNKEYQQKDKYKQYHKEYNKSEI